MKFKLLNFKAASVFMVVLVSFLLFLSSTQAASDMFAFLKKYDVHLCPEVHGRITLKGKPLPNIEILRGLTYGDDDELIDKVMTDEQGVFSFSEKNIRSRRPGSMLDESSTRQVININYNNKDYLLWYTRERGINYNKVIADRLQKLNCDLTNSEEEFELSNLEDPRLEYFVHSICRW
jgi:hypothetical protein